MAEVTLDDLKDQHARLKRIDDAAKKFRSYTEMLAQIKDLKEENSETVNRLDKEVRELKDELTFILRHRSRIAQFRHALMGSYRNPEKAFRTFEAMVMMYEPDSVLKKVSASPEELGALIGVDIVFIRTSHRDGAEENFEKKVVPTMEAVVKDHAYYLNENSTNWEDRIAEANKASQNAREEKREIDLLTSTLQLEQLTIAKNMPEEAAARFGPAEKRMWEWMRDRADAAIDKLRDAQARIQARAAKEKGPEAPHEEQPL